MSLLTIENVTKKFGVNTALSSINLEINRGEVHSLVGENGAGKSTLIKILSGVYEKSKGRLLWEGNEVDIKNPKVAHDLGINVIHQDRQLVPYFTGLENLYLYLPYPRKGLGVAWKLMKHEAQKLQEKWGMNIPLHLPVSSMSSSEKTLLEILRAMMTDSKLLILDEPTASLTDKESELLFSFIERLKEQGVAIVYISHRLEEVIRLSDQVSVLMGGNLMTTLKKDDVTKEALIYHMTGGQEMKIVVSQSSTKVSQSVLLKVENLTTQDQKVLDVNFFLHEGEILGVYGLAGAGRTECLEAIYGLRKWESGTVIFKDKHLSGHPGESIENGLVLIPENRHQDALIMENSIKENMTLPILSRLSKNGIVQWRKEIESVLQEMERFRVKAVDHNQVIGELSGGNQQKVVFAKALLCNPTVYLCDEPTQAVDVMTRTEIHLFLQNQAKEGKGVLYVSSDLHEILEVSDRILVFSEGTVVADLVNKNLSPNHILDVCYRFQKEALLD
ncbi:sugar ABC transporter ATP-binding protein [Peribacillus tepidiphilus]|uniref:sugar ABC transporter ATP-binding protein n=1 Tax=Peribacillus tepidiphilus TaxID=2652445 RepID=UPI0035B54BF9